MEFLPVDADGDISKIVTMDKPEVWWLQPESNMLYRDIMVYRCAPANQLKPVRVILNEKQRKFFFALREF